MMQSPGRFRAALLIGWLLLSAVGIVYARLKGIPSWAALPVLAAFLVEYPFYLLPGFPELRSRLSGARLPLFLVVSAMLPYLTCSLAAGQFQWISLLRLAALAVALGLWFLVLPRSALTDIGFLALIAAVLIGKYFDAIYALPYPGLNISVLGHIALIHMTALVLLVERRVHETGFGFVPSRREWRIGLLHYLACLPVAAVVAIPLRAVHLTAPAPLWKTAGTFLAFLLVVALFEEFLVRGVLQQWMEDWTWSRTAALWLTSAVFGLAHLWFTGGGRHFPNWRWALIAAVLGWFCGHARNQAGSIRAGVVTHALVVTTWRAFFV
jgi:membrane protease YdiL (CAAX protease family)